MKEILLVEDEKLIRKEVKKLLEKEGYGVKEVENFEDPAGQILASTYDLLILDLNLPDKSGFEVCQEVKEKSTLPILVLTSRDGVEDEVRALKLGADEYLTKPFRRERLLARIENLLKRYEGREGLLEGAGFLLDINTYTIYLNGTSKILPQNSGKIFETLLKAGGDLVTKDQLSLALWGTSQYIDENSLQVNIGRFKKLIKGLDLPYDLVSVRGKGYKLVERDGR